MLLRSEIYDANSAEILGTSLIEYRSQMSISCFLELRGLLSFHQVYEVSIYGAIVESVVELFAFRHPYFPVFIFPKQWFERLLDIVIWPFDALETYDSSRLSALSCHPFWVGALSSDLYHGSWTFCPANLAERSWRKREDRKSDFMFEMSNIVESKTEWKKARYLVLTPTAFLTSTALMSIHSTIFSLESLRDR